MLSKFIQRQRIKRNLTQEYLASELKMSRPTYMQIERGEREITISEAKKLAAIFDMSLEEFLQKQEMPVPKVIFVKEGKIPSAKKQEMRINVPRKNLRKFKEVLLYVLEKVGARPNVGETVLYKLLYFIDFDYYEKFEEQMIGATYIRNKYGPTPVEFKAIVEDMEKKGEIEHVKSSYFKYEQKKYLPRRQPDLTALSAQELGHLDEELSRLAHMSANEISAYSHDDMPWKAAEKNGNQLDYEMVFYRDYRHSVRNYDDDPL
ncbi:MAG: type II toxin-antitoxin system antitoxin SocA domain-containing protein [Candidatus Peregrinibacteria bacterium]